MVFDVHGVRFGCALGMEVHFPELFLEYERLDVDCMLFSSAGAGTPTSAVFAMEAQAHAATNSYWVSYAGAGQNAPSGLISPDGEWRARCADQTSPSLAVADLDVNAENLSRPWRRTARAGVYDAHLVHDDPRSDNRNAL